MPLYVRGTVSFGTVVATQVRPRATRRSSSSHWPPKPHSTPTPSPSRPPSRPATLVDEVGLGVSRVDAAVAKLSPAMADGGTVVNSGVGPNPAHDYGGPAPTHAHESGPDRHSRVLTRSHTSRTSYGGEPPSRGSSFEASTCSAAVLRSRCRSASASTDCSPSPASSARSCRCTSTPSAATTSERGNRPGSRLLRLRLRHAHARGDGDQFRHRLGARGLSRLRVLRPLQRGEHRDSRRGGGRAGTDRRARLSG